MNRNTVFWPRVSRNIERLKLRRHESAQGDASRQHKVIVDADICNACLGGVVEDRTPLTAGWRLIIKGVDLEGDELIVVVRLPLNDADPLEIEDFVIPGL